MYYRYSKTKTFIFLSFAEVLWCCRTDLNCRPRHYQWSALPLSYGSMFQKLALKFRTNHAIGLAYIASLFDDGRCFSYFIDWRVDNTTLVKYKIWFKKG